jgi:hypothetical protein
MHSNEICRGKCKFKIKKRKRHPTIFLQLLYVVVKMVV